MSEELDLREWGYAPGGYTFKCIDCPPEKNRPLDISRTAAKRSRRCKEHALTARAQAVTNPTPSPAPDGLREALGSLVSLCADQRDIFPDDRTALAVITDHINELYACFEDGCFRTRPAGDASPEMVERVARAIMSKMMEIDRIANDMLDEFMADPKADEVRKLARAALAAIGEGSSDE